MKYYVTTDIHGYDTYLREALDKAGFFAEKEDCKLIVCGDLLDRGGEARQLVDFMIELLKDGKLIYIRGNHEDLLVQCLQQIASGGLFEIASGMSHHYHNKTWDTLLQLSAMQESEAYSYPQTLIKRVMDSPFYQILLPKAIDYFETKHYIFTHGWIPSFAEGIKPNMSYTYDKGWRDVNKTSWQRARWFNGIELACRHGVKEPGKTVVCGHWHTSYGHSQIHNKGKEFGQDADFSPFYEEGIIALDSCVAASRKLNCIVIED